MGAAYTARVISARRPETAHTRISVNTHMTVSISSSYPIRLVNGKGVQLDSPPVPSTTTDDVIDARSRIISVTNLLPPLSQATVSMVGSSAINAATAGAYPIYTVPANMTLLPWQIVFVLTAISGSGDGPAISVGLIDPVQQLINSARVPDLFAEIDEVGDLVSVKDFTATAGHSGGDYKYLNGGSVLMAQVDTAATYSTYTLTCMLFGFLTWSMPAAAIPASPFGIGPYGLDSYGA